jgi:hypothetical protein
MKRSLYTMTALLLFTGCAIAMMKETHSPRAVVTKVDIMPPHPQVVIDDPVQFQKLVSFFQNLQDEKRGGLLYGLWEAKYKITLHFGDGSKIKVATAYDDKNWSSGKGDKSLKPGLGGFLDPMFKKE